MRAHVRVQKGLRKAVCEDAVLAGGEIINNGYREIELVRPFSILVADGVGGNSGAAEASRFVAERAATLSPACSRDALRSFVYDTNKSLLLAGENRGMPDMATTMTFLCAGPQDTRFAQVGNTRLYIEEGGRLRQMSRDQTTFQHFIDRHDMKSACYCNRSELRGFMGGGTEFGVSQLQMEDLSAGGALPSLIIMTSDGIHDYVPEGEMENILLRRKGSWSEATLELFNLAWSCNSADDKSIVIVTKA